MTSWEWGKVTVAVTLALVAAIATWRQGHGDWSFIALVALCASCSVMTVQVDG